MANVASARYLVFELFHTPSIGCTDQLETAYVFSEQSNFFLETLLSWARGPTDGNARGGGGRRRDGHRNPERGRREGGRQNGPGVHHRRATLLVRQLGITSRGRKTRRMLWARVGCRV